VPTYQDILDLVAAATTKILGANGEINGMTYTSPNGTLFFPASGYRVGANSYDQTTHGHYWSSEPYDATTAYRLSFHSSDPDDTGIGPKIRARPIRCVRPKIE
jgi:hypothetical protein